MPCNFEGFIFLNGQMGFWMSHFHLHNNILNAKFVCDGQIGVTGENQAPQRGTGFTKQHLLGMCPVGSCTLLITPHHISQFQNETL